MQRLPTFRGFMASAWCAERIRENRVIMAHEGSASMIADPLTKLTQPRVLFERGILARAKL